LRHHIHKKEKAPDAYIGAFLVVPRDRIELPTRGFSDQIFENSKILLLKPVDFISIFHFIFGFVGN
jgi:hypothetical protein